MVFVRAEMAQAAQDRPGRGEGERGGEDTEVSLDRGIAGCRSAGLMEQRDVWQ